MQPSTQRRPNLLPLASALVLLAAVGYPQEPVAPANKVRSVVPLSVWAFDLKDVRLRPGPFQHAQDLDRQYLLSLDVDRLLHNFRLNAGLPSSAQPLGGWEEPKGELRGHFVGHYLSACALMYASTGDPRLKQNGARVVAGLAQCQQKLGTGYLSAFPESFLDRVEHQQPVWAPWYTLHKILAGLLDMYVHCGNQQALQCATRFGDWVQQRTDRLSDEQMQRMLENEQGGISEALANLYALTGATKYLRLAQRFNHLAVLEPAAQEQDRLTGLHANTQIPKFIGAARQYELTGQAWLKTAALFFWNTVVKERSYVIGGDSDAEHFSPKERLSQALGPNTTETCNTYNMLKLTRHLFCWEPRAEYADYYERALYNQILASQNPDTGMMCYYVPLRSGSQKRYNTPLTSFWCCTGTGVENHAKYGDSIYFHDEGRNLYCNLFIASDLRWDKLGLRLRQDTAFPDQGRTRLLFTTRTATPLTLHVRRPAWATSGFAVRVNGHTQSLTASPGSYVVLNRAWRTGDRVEVALPFHPHTEGFADDPHRVALLNGPLVLCALTDQTQPHPYLLASDQTCLASLTPIAGQASGFLGPAQVFRLAWENSEEPVRFEPFYRVHGAQRYVVYWDELTRERWQAKRAQWRQETARTAALAARTIDQVEPGQPRSERAHALQGEHTASGDFNGRSWRHATEGGWFAWKLKVLPNVPQALLITYWGSDGGNRVFDLLVDGARLATVHLNQNRPDQFYDVAYPLPPALLAGKQALTVRFQAHSGAWAGGVFGVRLLREP